MKKLTYTKINHSDNAIKIDLHNGYSVIVISGWNPENKNYTTTMYLQDNTIDTLKLIEEAESLTFNANYKTINSAILKWVGVHLEDGTLQKYIDRYHYEMFCFDIGNTIQEVFKDRNEVMVRNVS